MAFGFVRCLESFQLEEEGTRRLPGDTWVALLLFRESNFRIARVGATGQKPALLCKLQSNLSFWNKISFHWSHWSTQPSPIRSIAAHLLAKAGLANRVSYRREGTRLRMRPAGLARLLWTEPERRLDGEVFLSKVLKCGNTFVDVGANIGILTLLAAKIVSPSGKVIAIEAHPKTHEALLDNLNLNQITNVIAINCAVGREEGMVSLSDRVDDDWNKIDDAGRGILIRLRTLDDVCGALNQIDVLKIDVEGYELPVLQGARTVLAKTQCVLLECWEEHTRGFGYKARDLIDFLEQHFFHGFLLAEQNGSVFLKRITREHIQQELENYVFVRDPSTLSSIGLVN